MFIANKNKIYISSQKGEIADKMVSLSTDRFCMRLRIELMILKCSVFWMVDKNTANIVYKKKNQSK